MEKHSFYLLAIPLLSLACFRVLHIAKYCWCFVKMDNRSGLIGEWIIVICLKEKFKNG
jgi:hypothetical protein